MPSTEEYHDRDQGAGPPPADRKKAAQGKSAPAPKPDSTDAEPHVSDDVSHFVDGVVESLRSWSFRNIRMSDKQLNSVRNLLSLNLLEILRKSSNDFESRFKETRAGKDATSETWTVKTNDQPYAFHLTVGTPQSSAAAETNSSPKEAGKAAEPGDDSRRHPEWPPRPSAWKRNMGLAALVLLGIGSIILGNAAVTRTMLSHDKSDPATKAMTSVTEDSKSGSSAVPAQVELTDAARKSLIDGVTSKIKPPAPASAPAAGPAALTDEQVKSLASNVATQVRSSNLSEEIASKVGVKDFATWMADEKNSEELARRIAAHVGKPAEEGAKNPPKNGGAPTPSSKEIASSVRDALKSDFTALASQFANLPKTAVPAAGGAARSGDLWIVGLHTTALDQSNYKEALSGLLGGFVRGPTAPLRVGFMLAESSKLAPVVKLEANQVALNLTGATTEAEEFPEGFGNDLAQRFDPMRPSRGVVLVASPSCPPLLPESPGWDAPSEVHVVLVANADLNEKQRRSLLDWHRFVHARHGTLRIVFPDDRRRQNEHLRKELQEICDSVFR